MDSINNEKGETIVFRQLTSEEVFNFEYDRIYKNFEHEIYTSFPEVHIRTNAEYTEDQSEEYSDIMCIYDKEPYSLEELNSEVNKFFNKEFNNITPTQNILSDGCFKEIKEEGGTSYVLSEKGISNRIKYLLNLKFRQNQSYNNSPNKDDSR